MNRTVISTGTICLQLVLCLSAWAQPKLPFAPSAAEMLMLPEECQAILKHSPAAATYLQRLPGLVGPNHYCWGLNFMNRAKIATDKIERRFNLQSAIGEFGYVLQHSAPNAKGLQQVQAQKALAEAMLKLL